MEKRRSTNWSGKQSDLIEQETVSVSDVPNDVNVPEMVVVRSLRQAIVKTTGKVTGGEYYWPGSGSICPVDVRDWEYLAEKGKHKSCCDSQGAGYFELVV